MREDPRQKRPDLPALDRLSIGFFWEGKGPFLGELANLERRSICVRFPISGTPPLPLAAPIELYFVGLGLDDARADARLIYSAREGESLVYDFQIQRASQEAIEQLLSIRQNFRVPPHAGIPIRMQLQGEGSERKVEALVKDLSEGGAAVLVGEDDDAALFDSEKLQLRLLIPGGPPIDLVGCVRYRMISGSSIRYGIQFDPECLRVKAHDQIRIARYIFWRQQEMIRATNEARESV